MQSRTKERAKKAGWGELHGPRLDRWKLGTIQRERWASFSCFSSCEPWHILGTTEVGTSCRRTADRDKDEAPLCKGLRYHTRYNTSDISKCTGRLSASSEEEFIKTSVSFEHISVLNHFFHLALDSNGVYCFSRFGDPPVTETRLHDGKTESP